jgi:basic amino acid/polyamine antiporter, APA family
MAETTDDVSGHVELPKSLSLLQVTAGGVAIIVGAGIYVLLGPATERAGAFVWLAFLLSAVLCGLTALSYMELSSMFTRTGGEYEYARQVFSPRLSFVIGWAMLSGLVVASATVALGFGRYTEYFFDISPRIPALLLLAAIALFSAKGLHAAAWLIVILTCIEVGGLVFVSVIGVSHVGDVNIFEGVAGSGFEQFNGLMSAVALVFFAFIGFDEVVTLSEETHNARRNTPIALALALLISAVLYVMVAIVAVSVLGPEDLSASPYPLAEVAEAALGSLSGDVMSVLAMITTTSTVLLGVVAASRMAFAMARRNDLPRRLAIVNHNGSPQQATLAVVAVSAIFVLWGDFTVIAGATDALIYVMFLAVNVIVVILRFRQPLADRAFRIPLAIAKVPVFPVAAFGVTVWMLTLLDLESLVIGAGILLSGVVLYSAVHKVWVRSS